MLNWYSPVPESLAPSEGDLFEKNYGPSLRDEVVRVNGASIMNCVTDADSVKHKIMEGYAGVFDMYFDRSLRALFDGYNTMNSGGRIDPGTPTNHEVLLIGWDDAYPKENFKYPPSADGAWLIRNSHGTGGNSGNGYIWLSYESKWDASVLFFDRMANESEDAMYFHDRCISIGTDLEFEDAATMANVFHASGRQRISSVGLASFNDAGFDYTIEVYTSLKDVTDPTSGDLESVQKGRIDYAGSHCIGLNRPVEVRTGQTFSICVTYEKPAGVVRVPIDTYEVVSNAEDGYVSDPIAHFGESFVLIDGEWVDISADGMSNVRVRAYADAVEESDAPVIAIAVAIIVAVLGFMVASFRR